MMVEFSENRKLTVEEKLEETLYELNATKNKLLAADKYLKVTEEEMEKYRQEVEEMQEELQEFNLTFNHKIAVQERNALANWVRRGVREFPHCPGLLRMPYHMGWNVPDFPHPHPPPQWWTCGPQPHLVPPPHGLQSQSEACGAQGDNSSTVPEKVPEKNQIITFWLCQWRKGRVCVQIQMLKHPPQGPAVLPTGLLWHDRVKAAKDMGNHFVI
ncbi:uncharacterized protein LOC122908961 isoform X3 [Neovison vison]|uniref:uncharacterized protein LOC122908961 isoform X3 n=1 Tax=Neovison vison TaxID=452646 RepID=UPI001CEFC1C7|nr:uncharacterized protein LOC122908961 isoform X3 [Neogale vison]